MKKIFLFLMLCFYTIAIQAQPPANAKVITVNTTANATIQIDLIAAAANTPVWVETSTGNYTAISVGTSWTGYVNYTINGNSLKIHGDITGFNCTNNGTKVTGLDVSANTALTFLYCYNNNLSQLDVSANTALTFLYCYNNNLSQLDVSANTALTELYCYNNNLSQLDLSANTALTFLGCYNNNLSQLDLSANTALTDLGCYNNNLSQLDVSANTALTYLRCYNNNLSQLDVSANTALTELYCFNNNLSQLDVSANTALTELYCFNNNLSQLDVSTNTALTLLSCFNNNLSYLNVANGNNNNMTFMRAENNSNLTCIQHDNGFDPTTNINWKKDATASWSDSPCLLLVDSIIVQGEGGATSINTKGGTLQMEATVLPNNATDSSYTWSLTDTTIATINQNGLLTAVSDGTVRVIATANDASGVSGSVEITISNQSVGIKDVAFQDLKIYPNPTQDKLYIKSTEHIQQVQLKDLSGKTIKSYDNPKVLDLSNLAKGLYFIHLKNEKKQSLHKVMVK